MSADTCIIIGVILCVYSVIHTVFIAVKRKKQRQQHLTKRKYKRDMKKLNELLDRYYG